MQSRDGSLIWECRFLVFRKVDWRIPLLLSVLLVYLSFDYFLLFHTLAEFFAIIIAIIMFVVVWEMYPFTRNNFLMFLGTGYFWIAMLDLLHSFLYEGMNILPVAGGNYSTQLWILSRYSEALLLLSAPLFMTRPFYKKPSFVFFGLVAGFISALVLSGNFPDCFIEGKGLTKFKIYSEYIIIGILAIAVYHLFTRRAYIEKNIMCLMIASIILTMGAELALTYYVSVFGLSNIIGHIFKLFSFWLIFTAVIRITLQEPFAVMARSSSTYDAVPDITIIVDANQIIRSANREALRFASIAEVDLLGKHCHDIFHPSYLTVDQCQICQSIKSGRSLVAIGVEFPAIQKWFDFSLSPIIAFDSLKGTVQVMRDITVHKKSEQELAKYRNDLEKMVKKRTYELSVVNKELESFSYSVSHDLRAPLRGIDGFSRALLEDHEDKLDEEGKDYLRELISSAGQMSQLIDSLLILSRITRKEIKHKQIDLKKLALTVVKGLNKANPQRKVIFDIEDNLCVNADLSLMKILIQNLLENAWKYSENNSDAKIEFGSKSEGGYEVFFIRDNGAGFDMKYYNKLFGAFQRLHTEIEFKGIGIGLATVQRIINRHGGQIWAEGQVDKGATFYFTLNS